MNGRTCILCGKGGCTSCVEVRREDLMMIFYICDVCKEGDYKLRVIKKFLERIGEK